MNKFERLVQTGLYGDNLVTIDHPNTVERYNLCLQRLGLTATRLPSFSIDGIGWSPEIAEEKGDHDYLSHGPANPLGIIVSINQRRKPVYRPTHSVDRLMLSRYFEKYATEIAEITLRTGIALDLDQRMNRYRTIDDLTMIDHILVLSDAGNISRSAERQKELVREMQDLESDAWMDDDLRREIIESVTEHGDWRNRTSSIAPFEFREFGDIYTRALGGVYIFRHQSDPVLIVVEDKEQLKNVSPALKNRTIHIDAKDIVSRAIKSKIVGIDQRWYMDNLEVLKDRLDGLARFVVSKQDPEADVDQEFFAAKIGSLMDGDDSLIELFDELERVCIHFSRGDTVENLSTAATLFLLHPINFTSKYEENLLWQFICRIQEPVADPMRQYAVDKNEFFRKFGEWSESMCSWLCKRISEHYDRKRSQKENSGH